METLLLQSRSVITNPKYGRLIDINSGLQIRLDARTLSLPQGAAVDAWIAEGSGSLKERSFNKNPASWGYPTYDASSKPSVKFAGNEMLANDNKLGVQITSATYIIVCKLDDLNAADSSQNRIFTGDLNTNPDHGYHSVYPRNGVLRMSVGSGVPTPDIEVDTKWFVGVFVFDGANTRYITSITDTVVSNSTIPQTQDRISIGGNINVSTPQGLAMQGNIALFAQYSTAFSDDDMRLFLDYYRKSFSI